MSARHPADPAQQPASFSFMPENETAARAIVAKYPDRFAASAILPLLDLAQRQHGWLPLVAIQHVARFLDVAEMRVMECATFYTMFNLRPVGRHHVEVCTNISCWLRGSNKVLAVCRSELGVDLGETTPDGAFTLSEAECLGACVNAPMMQIGDDYYEDLSGDNVRAILGALRRGETPKTGPQNGRRTCEPLGGPTTLSNPTSGPMAGMDREKDGAD